MPFMQHNHGDITYTHGLRNDLTEQPTNTGRGMWQVHMYLHDERRYTWDIAAGKVYGVRDETYGPIRGRKYYGWYGHDMPLDTPLPVAITEEANTHA